MASGEMFDPLTVGVIVAMALATLALRLLGYGVMALVPVTDRVRRMFEALPGSVIAATVVPAAVAGGPAAMIALGLAGVVMVVTRRDVLAVATGVVGVAVLRALGL